MTPSDDLPKLFQTIYASSLFLVVCLLEMFLFFTIYAVSGVLPANQGSPLAGPRMREPLGQRLKKSINLSISPLVMPKGSFSYHPKIANNVNRIVNPSAYQTCKNPSPFKPGGSFNILFQKNVQNGSHQPFAPSAPSASPKQPSRKRRGPAVGTSHAVGGFGSSKRKKKKKKNWQSLEQYSLFCTYASIVSMLIFFIC